MGHRRTEISNSTTAPIILLEDEILELLLSINL